jgi:RES domain
LRKNSAFAVCLDPDSYVQSQTSTERLLATGSLGTLYPSVRYAGGTCLACFRRAIIANVRTGTWSLSVTRNRRLTFLIDATQNEIYDVNLEDYH